MSLEKHRRQDVNFKNTSQTVDFDVHVTFFTKSQTELKLSF